MGNKCIYNWQSVDAYPLYSATIKIMFEETEQQHLYINYLKNETYQIEKSLATKIIRFYHAQLNKVMYYEEQIKQWLFNTEKSLNEHILNEISELKKIVLLIKQTSHSIIEIAEKAKTIEECDITVFTGNKKKLLDFINENFEEKNDVKN